MRAWNKLSATKVAAAKGPGKWGDGGGLFLRSNSDGGSKAWVFAYMRNRRAREMGLAMARMLAAKCREQLALDLDPIEERNKVRAAERAAAARRITFEQAAQNFLAGKEGTWRNAQHKTDWKQSLTNHVYPTIGKLSISDVDTPAVLRVLEPIWREKPELGSRLRSRIEAVLAWGSARDYRPAENPARWKHHLDRLLPNSRSVRPVRHHASLPWKQLPAFMTDLRQRTGIEARTLEFLVLNAARVTEVVGASWSEFDFSAKVWVIPAERMKARRPHIVPLSARSLEILRGLDRRGEQPFPLHRTTVRKMLHRMGFDHVTQHGFRASFKTWCDEATRTEQAVKELSLAHTVGNKVEQAYSRGVLLEKRRKLMAMWSDFCASLPKSEDRKVVALRA